MLPKLQIRSSRLLRLTCWAAMVCVAVSIFCVSLSIGVAEDTETVAVEEASETNAADRKLARETLVKWRDQLSASDMDWFHKKMRLEISYDDAWSTIDIEQAIALRESGHIRASNLFIMARLAAAGRWNDVVRFSDDVQKGHYHLHQFWAQMADEGYQLRDMSIVELAGKQVEANATFLNSPAGGPPIPRRELLNARFFVAAARLEVLRDDLDIKKWKETSVAASELVRAARAIQPMTSTLSFGTVPTTHALQRYAVLESWSGTLKPADGWNASSSLHGNPALSNQKEMPELAELAKKASILWRLALPTLDQEPVTAWIQRQVAADRHLVALSYLLRADGPNLDRARLLAIVAAGIADSYPDDARVCRELAKSLVDQEADGPAGSKVEATSELALAYQSAGETKTAKLLSQQAVGDWQSMVAAAKKDVENVTTKSGKPAKPKINYTAMSAMASMIAKTGWTRSELPSEVLFITDRLGFHGKPYTKLPIRVRNIDRVVDFSEITSPQKMAAPASHESRYYKLLESGQFAEATLEVIERAKGNGAWSSNYPNIAQQSVQEMGLAKTLEWTAKIENIYARMYVEIEAVREAIKSDRKVLPRARVPYRANTTGAGLYGAVGSC